MHLIVLLELYNVLNCDKWIGESEMYLKKFIIKNFRIFDEAGIELIFNKGINAIIGENNSGKSSIIDALRSSLISTTFVFAQNVCIGDNIEISEINTTINIVSALLFVFILRFIRALFLYRRGRNKKNFLTFVIIAPPPYQQRL